MKKGKRTSNKLFLQIQYKSKWSYVTHNVIEDEFLKYVHDIDISFMKEDRIMKMN